MPKYDSNQEQKKFYAARFIRDKQYQCTPSSKGKLSWLEWWQAMFNDDYQTYSKRMGVFEVDGPISFGEALRRSRVRERKRRAEK